ALKGGGVDGVCAPVPAGPDPHGGCAVEPPSSCGTTGVCDGSGACAHYPVGTTCAPQTCASGSLVTSACIGVGVCQQTTTSWRPYACGAGVSCATSCSVDAQCAPSSFCRTADGSCQPQAIAGISCSAAEECASGFCVDGYCCDASCTGPCRAC